MFPMKYRMGVYPAAHCQGSLYGKHYGFFVDNWKRSGQSQTDRADVAVGLDAYIIGWTGTKHLGFGGQLNMYLKAYDGNELAHFRSPPKVVTAGPMTFSITEAVFNMSPSPNFFPTS